MTTSYNEYPEVILDRDIQLETDEIKFYADPETLKQASGYYTFMNSLPADTKSWVENCHSCQRSMIKIMIDAGTKLEVIPGSAVGMPEDQRHWTVQYKSYIKEPSSVVINPHQVFWFCPGCCSVWTMAVGCWVRIAIAGEQTLSAERIKSTQEMVRGAQAMVADAMPDPGEKLSPDSTKCPHCHLWRVVKPWEQIPGEDSGKNIHICPKCGTGDIFDVGGQI